MTTPHDETLGKLPLRHLDEMVFPFFGGRAAWPKQHLLPIFVTVFTGLALVSTYNKGAAVNDADVLRLASRVYLIIAIYIAFLINCYVYEMCGRATNWLLIAVVAYWTFATLDGPLLWHNRWYALFNWIIPAEQWKQSSHFAVHLVGAFAGTGLGEESFKSLPLFAFALFGVGLVFVGSRTRGKVSELLKWTAKRFSLRGPLDGIVLGAASGAGFFIKETLGQYVPETTSHVHDAGLKAFDGLVLLLGRLLPQIAGHCAYSGLFGYYIGLSLLQPRKAVYLIPLGWLSAAALHAVYDIGFLPLQLVVSVLSYALLAGAIFTAREIFVTSPFHSES